MRLHSADTRAGGVFGRGRILKKQGVAVDWQCPVAIIKKVKAVPTNNKRVPYAV